MKPPLCNLTVLHGSQEPDLPATEKLKTDLSVDKAQQNTLNKEKSLTWKDIFVILTLYLMRLNRMRTFHLLQDRHNFLSERNFFPDRPKTNSIRL